MLTRFLTLLLSLLLKALFEFGASGDPFLEPKPVLTRVSQQSRQFPGSFPGKIRSILRLLGALFLTEQQTTVVALCRFIAPTEARLAFRAQLSIVVLRFRRPAGILCRFWICLLLMITSLTRRILLWLQNNVLKFRAKKLWNNFFCT